MTIKHLNNISIPVQSTLEASDSGFGKIQVVLDRLYSNSNKVAFKDEFSDLEETNPTYTYTSGELTRIDYASGNYKLFTYSIGNLIQLDFVKGSVIYRKIFNYDVSGNLISILYSVI